MSRGFILDGDYEKEKKKMFKRNRKWSNWMHNTAMNSTFLPFNRKIFESRTKLRFLHFDKSFSIELRNFTFIKLKEKKMKIFLSLFTVWLYFVGESWNRDENDNCRLRFFNERVKEFWWNLCDYVGTWQVEICIWCVEKKNENFYFLSEFLRKRG